LRDVKATPGRSASDASHLFHPPPSRRATDRYNDVDRLGDELRIRRHAGLLNQLSDTDQRAAGIKGMDRADAARMAGVPRLEPHQGAGIAHFSGDDTIRPQSHRRAQ